MTRKEEVTAIYGVGWGWGGGTGQAAQPDPRIKGYLVLVRDHPLPLTSFSCVRARACPRALARRAAPRALTLLYGERALARRAAPRALTLLYGER